jgi:hypothetical protein
MVESGGLVGLALVTVVAFVLAVLGSVALNSATSR